MELNANFSLRASVHGASLDWTPSPIAGVDRRMLDRIGEEVARATSIVRYAPNSHFSPHTHGGGEEFLVLEGVFQDEHGDFPVGSYIRNPPETRHTPRSATGCVIFVKLWQFHLADRMQVRIDTSAIPFVAAEDRPGVDIKPLFHDAHEDVRLERWAPDARIMLPSLPGGGEILVLEGSFSEGSETFAEQSWLRLPKGATFDGLAGSNGCRVWVKAGHLTTEPAAPR